MAYSPQPTTYKYNATPRRFPADNSYASPVREQRNVKVDELGDKGQYLAEFIIPRAFDEAARTIITIETLASYNWMEDSKCTIAVPGSPNLWSPPVKFPVRLQADTKPIFVDQDSFRMPNNPMEPMLAATLEMHPDFDFGAVDIVTSRNSLRKLYSLVSGSAEKTFRIDAEVIGQTLFLRRFETENKVLPFRNSFGFAFEAAMSDTPGGELAHATAYHRVSLSEWNGLKILMRFEVDAAESETAGKLPQSKSAALAGSLDHLVGGLKVEHKAQSAGGIESGELAIKKIGKLVEDSRILELSTRSQQSRFPVDWRKKCDQLFLSQTPNLYFGEHFQESFSKPKKMSLAEVEAKAGPEVRDDMARLNKLLCDVLVKAKVQQDEKLVLSGEGSSLKAYAAEARDCPKRCANVLP